MPPSAFTESMTPVKSMTIQWLMGMPNVFWMVSIRASGPLLNAALIFSGPVSPESGANPEVVT